MNGLKAGDVIKMGLPDDPREPRVVKLVSRALRDGPGVPRPGWYDEDGNFWDDDFISAHRIIELSEGVKYDEGKPPYHLIAPELNTALAEILEFGAKKYAPRNWEKGMAWHKPFRACIGHLWDWWRKAGPDAETGKSHLWHAACCIMFLIAYEARGIGEDDRP